MQIKHTTLIVIGGSPGSGKSAVATKVAEELAIPVFASDFFGSRIKQSEALLKDQTKAYWLGYELLFECAREQLRMGVSVIIDTNMGWEFQWVKIDQILTSVPNLRFIPIILKADPDVCETRILCRYNDHPNLAESPEFYQSEKVATLRRFLDELERPEIVTVDANQSLDIVCQSVLRIINP